MKLLAKNTIIAALLTMTSVFSAQSKMQVSTRMYSNDSVKKIMLDGGKCNGMNMSPEIAWTEVEDARSYAVVVQDETDNDLRFYYWTAYNIKPSTTLLIEDISTSEIFLENKIAAQSQNDYGRIGYSGPCHVFNGKKMKISITVYALNIARLPIEPGSTSAWTQIFINHHTINKAKTVIQINSPKK